MNCLWRHIGPQWSLEDLVALAEIFGLVITKKSYLPGVTYPNIKVKIPNSNEEAAIAMVEGGVFISDTEIPEITSKKTMVRGGEKTFYVIEI